MESVRPAVQVLLVASPEKAQCFSAAVKKIRPSWAIHLINNVAQLSYNLCQQVHEIHPQGPTLVFLCDPLPEHMQADELITAIRQQVKTKHTPIIVLSEKNDSAYFKMLYTTGASTCFESPVNEDNLATLIRLIAVYWEHALTSSNAFSTSAHINHPLNKAHPFNILLVEDNLLDQQLVEAALKRLPLTYRLSITFDGDQAIQYLLKQGDYQHNERAYRPDLILMDINLPKRSGFDVLKVMKETPTLQSIYTVMLTTSQYDHDKTTAFEHGANAFVTKPVDVASYFEIFEETLNTWLNSTQPIN